MLKIFWFFIAFFLFTFSGFSQNDKVKVTPRYQSEERVIKDKEQCSIYADEQVSATKHKTLKNTGAGAGIGAIAGKILGKPGLGAAAGAAGGAYRGHKKSSKDKKEINQVYAACLREKGYEVEVEE